MKFSQALALLRQWRGAEPLLHEAARFYRIQLHRHSEAVAYLYQRGVRSLELIEHMRIGYAGFPASGAVSDRLAARPLRLVCERAGFVPVHRLN